MSIQFTPEEFRTLVRIVQNLPDFRTETGRWRLVDAALEGSPRADTIRGLLDLSGNPMGAAVSLLKVLNQFGQVAYGKEPLGVFLNYIQPFTGNEGNAFLSDLFARYPGLGEVSKETPLGTWRGKENTADVLERIIGENTLRDVRMLELAMEASRAVALLRVPIPGDAYTGSGFMIASDLLMTNHHVIAVEEERSLMEVVFNYQLDRKGRECQTQTVRARAGGIFYTHPDLDFTVVQLEQPPDFSDPLRLEPTLMQPEARVAIIQHPGGHLKKISLQNNRVVYADRQTVQYTTSTLPGSSGSPVFDDDFRVIAIHSRGGMIEEPGGKQYYLRNQGTSMIAVLDALKAHAPEVFERVRGN
ncbi:MAG: trypsin-like peptidase domain-containing protein [Anaerolineae bacterium]|nr:trypsin-like peptidase domain-containing protein [Anaerolineae bacterium]